MQDMYIYDRSRSRVDGKPSGTVAAVLHHFYKKRFLSKELSLGAKITVRFRAIKPPASLQQYWSLVGCFGMCCCKPFHCSSTVWLPCAHWSQNKTEQNKAKIWESSCKHIWCHAFNNVRVQIIFFLIKMWNILYKENDFVCVQKNYLSNPIPLFLDTQYSLFYITALLSAPVCCAVGSNIKERQREGTMTHSATNIPVKPLSA